MLCATAPVQAKSVEDDPYGDASEINASPLGPADVGFSNLFSSLQRLDGEAKQANYIPSGRPVEKLSLTSNFGARSDPFNGRTRMHKGVDIPGPVGTPIYATADGVVQRAEWNSGGYGNLVELNHGHGIQTRYGHLTRSIVNAGERVKRGQLIAYMGSTGRSTGSHLHYEVRIDGQAVNPIPFLQSTAVLASVQRRAATMAIGGPAAGSN